MIELHIDIDRASVMDYVSAKSAYIGAKLSDDGSLFEKVSTTSGNEDILGMVWEKVMGDVTTLLSSYRTTEVMAVSDGLYSAKMAMPDNWNTDTEWGVKKNVTAIAGCLVLSEWLMIAGEKELADEEMKDSEKHALGVVTMLNSRVRPQRPAAYEFKEVE